ncbi:MAG: FAD-dependent oxidoreductase, partial [Candidatus Zixiibacteriota bacterium]
MSKRQDILEDGTLIIKEPVKLPDVLDVLFVGGGPAGTAAAFHAKELGLKALVIDFDDILKRIRDYAKDKQILPGFGGGDKMKFPAGGSLVQNLHFEPIDKDDMQLAWKKFYVDNSIPAKIKVELTGLEKGNDSVWNAKIYNHNLKKDEIIKTRHIVLAMGGGEPRRFDIPGNTEGIQYRLNDASSYVRGPVCIIGGGTSAAEAVIAISNVKKEGSDHCEVYWSYRGTTMPAVSKALAEVFFDVHMNNGNIKYLPNSDAVAIVTAEDKNEYLSVRVDRRQVDGRPSETTHVEFLKENCIACIGQDLPERILGTMGISMAVGGPSDKKRMVVTRQLETQQNNVYMIGDLLSQAYFETDDFNSDPKGFAEIKHRGNIKSALRDGVYVAKVIANRLAGKPDTDIVLDESE